VWSYGDRTYPIIVEQLRLRERLKGYILAQMAETARSGVPMMRPLFVDYPRDDLAWRAEDQYMFGPDLLIAPVTELGDRARDVYLPDGTAWIEAFTGIQHAGGQVVNTEAPLPRIPVFTRAGADPLPLL
jgi:alpha-D-xyloside xylohydrolase